MNAITDRSDGRLVRTERAKLSVNLTKDQYEQLKEHADRFLTCGGVDLNFQINHGDTLNLSYTFNIEYFGNVVAAFESFLKMLDHDGVGRDADLSNLDGAELLIKRLVNRIEEVKARFPS
jgi:hypothetical protein